MRFSLVKKNEDPFLGEFDLGLMLEKFFKEPFAYGFGLVEQEPAIDVYEDQKDVVVRAELPGLKPGDVKVSVEKDVLVLSGEKRKELETRKKNYCQVRSSYGKFQRVINLPCDVAAEKGRAAYKDGVLSIRMPKDNADRKKTDINIDIQ